MVLELSEVGVIQINTNDEGCGRTEGCTVVDLMAQIQRLSGIPASRRTLQGALNTRLLHVHDKPLF